MKARPVSIRAIYLLYISQKSALKPNTKTCLILDIPPIHEQRFLVKIVDYFKIWVLEAQFEYFKTLIVNYKFPEAGVKQQPPMHEFRMRPFKPFWG